MDNSPLEAALLRDWFAARKAERLANNEPFTLDDAAVELSGLRRVTVYAHQVCTWMKHGRMSPTTREFIRSALGKDAAPQQVRG